jgi:hypothetical protein
MQTNNKRKKKMGIMGIKDKYEVVDEQRKG